MRSTRLAAAGLALGALLLPGGAARAQQTAYAIANGGTTLIRFDTANPTAAVAVGNFSGGATFLDAIDFRPSNGQLYGYLDATDTVYTVDLATATLTAVATGTGTGATNTNLLGIDFNPTTGGGTGNLFRLVTDSTQNLVYNVTAPGSPTVATSLFYPAGDVAANNPLGGVHVIENAYTNNLLGAATTQQYGIDYVTGSLVTIANNAGTLGTVGNTLGNLGVSINQSAPFVGFDIFTSFAGIDTAYAVLDTTAGTAPGLYTINLSTGAATSVGAIGGGFTQVYSLAVTPTAVPEAGTVSLLLLGALSAASAGAAPMLRRRKRLGAERPAP
jgi:hypothetical protein